MDAPALAAAVGGSALGLAGIALTARNATKERKHQRRLVGEERVYQARATTYVDLLTTLGRMVREMEGASPAAAAEDRPVSHEHRRLSRVLTPEQRAETWIVQREERLSLEARLAAFGSAPVREAAERVFAEEEAFAVYWSDPEAFDELNDAATTARDALTKVESLVRDELASFTGTH